MLLLELFESVPSPVQKKILDSVVSTVKKADADIDAHLHRADYDDWLEIRIGNESCSFRVKEKVLYLANMYLPKKLQQQGLMTAILKGIKETLGTALNGKCKVIAGMNQAGWQKIVERAGFDWVPGMTREEFLKNISA
jgi:hypothetical protein